MNTTNSPSSSSRPDSFDSFTIAGNGSADRVESHRKKRSKLGRSADPGPSESWKPKSVKKPNAAMTAAKITRPCTECGKRFWSWKALFGHMRCHPERQWRGINPPPNFRRPVAIDENRSLSSIAKLTDEDHEVATCLVMLSSGVNSGEISRLWTDRCLPESGDSVGEPSETAEADAARSEPSNCRFECSSCKRVFGSHQALGGHRASHKNVKGCFAIDRKEGDDEEGGHNCVDGDEDARISEEGKMMVVFEHKCSICTRVFSSGQALGGHKRCHWEKGDEFGVSCSSTTKACGLDLNLPAPVENEESSSSDLVLDLRLGI